VGEHEGQPFFTMELIEGSGLDKFIGPDGYRPKAGTQEVEDHRSGPQAGIARIMIQIARAVDHAHKYGVLHRDLKPANILIDAKGEPHLTDFGLAKVLSRAATTATASGAVLGTPAYMAPEQASGGSKHASTASDIYSLGAIFYEMLTGHPPFRAETPLETLRRVVEEQPKPPSTFNRNLDADLAIICLKCLEKDPTHRYGSALAMAEDLERWLRGEPIAARSARRMERLWRWCRREPALAGLMTGLFLLMVAVAALALILYQKKKADLEQAERIKSNQMTALLNRLESEWLAADRDRVRISPQELALIAGHSLVEEGGETPVVLGFISRLRKPDEAIQSIAPLLIYLQTNLAAAITPQPLFELQIFKSRTNAINALLKEEVDIMRVDPADYIFVRSQNTNIFPLAKQAYTDQPDLRGVIFTRADSVISNLWDLKGKALAFGEHGSALGDYLPKAALATLGLLATDFPRITNDRSTSVIGAVRTHAFDAGVAEKDDFDNAIKLGVRLKLLHELNCPNFPWLATRRIDRAVADAITQRLLSLRDSDAPLPFDPKLTGFESARTAEYDALGTQIEQAKIFGQTR
jgi:ABC-type phosphate/phosphonate transport system substrate-binding protein